MNCIVVADSNWGIGRDNDLLVHLPGDLKYYKEKTIGKVIVIGRKTLESFPGGKPLPGRTNLVLTGNMEYSNDACVVCHGMDELREKMAGYRDEDIFISGGESIYNQFIDECDVLYVTRLESAFPADRHFRNLDEDDRFEVTWESGTYEENGVRYRFVRYDRKNA